MIKHYKYLEECKQIFPTLTTDSVVSLYLVPIAYKAHRWYLDVPAFHDFFNEKTTQLSISQVTFLIKMLVFYAGKWNNNAVYKYLKERFGAYSNQPNDIQEPKTVANLSTASTEVPQVPDGYAGLTLKQIAIIYVYEGKLIKRGEQANQIASKFGYKSGEKLYQYYTRYSNCVDRTGDEISKIKLKNKISTFNIIIDCLSTDAKCQALDELALLKTRLEHYE